MYENQQTDTLLFGAKYTPGHLLLQLHSIAIF